MRLLGEDAGRARVDRSIAPDLTNWAPLTTPPKDRLAPADDKTPLPLADPIEMGLLATIAPPAFTPRTPPFRVTALAAGRLDEEPSNSIPALTKVPPEYVFCPVIVRAPGPALVSVPLPETMPAKLRAIPW
jgi:hypothetical protein